MNDRGNVIMSETRGKREDAFTPIKVYPSGTSSFSFRFILIIEKKRKCYRQTAGGSCPAAAAIGHYLKWPTTRVPRQLTNRAQQFKGQSQQCVVEHPRYVLCQMARGNGLVHSLNIKRRIGSCLSPFRKGASVSSRCFGWGETQKRLEGQKT